MVLENEKSYQEGALLHLLLISASSYSQMLHPIFEGWLEHQIGPKNQQAITMPQKYQMRRKIHDDPQFSNLFWLSLFLLASGTLDSGIMISFVI